jgi:hypothetical protein
MSELSAQISWGADTAISMPEPLAAQRPGLVPMGGFTFTIRGIAHDFTEADRETYLIPTFGPDPYGLAGEVPRNG